jgi:hypothetical protein
VRTKYRPNDLNNTDARSTRRCFRHHVWMAYCGDCREAHALLLRKNRETGSPKP